MSFKDFMLACSTMLEEDIDKYIKENKKNIQNIDKTINKIKDEKEKPGVLESEKK